MCTGDCLQGAAQSWVRRALGRVLTPLLLGLRRLLLRCRNHLEYDVLNGGCYTNAYEIIECSSMMQLIYFNWNACGLSAIQLCRPTRTNYLSGQISIYTADRPALLGGPSAVLLCQTTRDDNVSGQNSRLYGGLSALQ